MTQLVETQVVVLGSGPAGYAAAFRCADLGLGVTIVERYPTLGGVCLNVGCIPSKALLHIARVMEEAKGLSECGVSFEAPHVDLDKIRSWKQQVIGQLTGGLAGMGKQRKVQVVEGTGQFISENTIEVTGKAGVTTVKFEKAIIAAGSRPVELPFIPHDDPRVWDSTDALALPFIPKRLLVVGGGIIGLEMGTVYRALGAAVSVVEFAPQLVPAADVDMVKLYTKHVKDQFDLMLETKVVKVDAAADGLHVAFEGKAAVDDQMYDAVLVAVGRRPSGHLIGAEKAGVEVTDAGFIETDKQMRTNVPHIFAVGDVVGQPMLAHKGAHEGHVAAEVIAGADHFFTPKVIPSIAYTSPEIGWVGLTEKEAIARDVAYEVVQFPWAALGRAIAAQAAGGTTKLLFGKKDGRLLGGAVVGENGGELLGEIGLAIEMGADAADLGLTIHAHPTLYESVGLAAEVMEGTVTDLPNKKAKKK